MKSTVWLMLAVLVSGSGIFAAEEEQYQIIELRERTNPRMLDSLRMSFEKEGWLWITELDSLAPGHKLIELKDRKELRWSPNRSLIAFRKDDDLWKIEPDSLAKPKKIAKNLKAGKWNWGWETDTSLLAYEQIHQEGQKRFKMDIERIVRIFLNGNKQIIVEDTLRKNKPDRLSFPQHLKDGSIVYFESSTDTLAGHFKKKSRKMKIIKRGSNPDSAASSQLHAFTTNDLFGGSIWLESIDGSYSKRVTYGSELFEFPDLSRDQNMIASRNQKGEIIVLDTSGNVISTVGKGVLPALFPKGDYLTYLFEYKDSRGRTTYDIIVSDLLGKHKKQLMFTPEEDESSSQWAVLNGTALLYSSQGKIYLCKIIPQNTAAANQE